MKRKHITDEDMEIAEFIGDRFQYAEFIHEILEIEMPNK